MDKTNEWEGIQTKVVHAAADLNQTHAVNPPIWQTSTFRADSPEHFAELGVMSKPAEFYTRYGNPGHEQAEAVIAALEGAEAALVTSSGMGAIFTAIMCGLKSGDHVVAQRNHYGGATTLMRDYLPRWGVECTQVDQTSIEAFVGAMRPNTKLVYAESPTNPLMVLTDLRALAREAKSRGIPTIVDNTFATPVNQRPLEMGIDVVVHSATKYLGGHNDLTAGAIAGSRAFIEQAWNLAVVNGATLSPFDAWLLLRGMRTLGLRVAQHNRNALAMARFLEEHPRVERVYYPGLQSHPQHALAREQMSGFTGMLSVEIKGGYEAAERFIQALKLGTYAASLGGFVTLAVQPAAMWGHYFTPEQRQATGLSESLVRISIGLEDERDLIRDFAQALEA
ncbi:MAG: trans-sulfuration enzyme family protein [Chloroflexia bacterium]